MISRKPILKRTIVFNKKALIQAKNFEIIQDLKELTGILFEARGCYNLWWVYLEALGDTAYFPTVLKFKDYFQISAYAHISNLVISLYKLYDGGNDVLNIENLSKIVIERNYLDAENKSKIILLLSEAKVIWKKVAILRSNLFAHRTNKLSKNAIYQKAKITPNQFRELTDKSLEILNILAASLNEPILIFRNSDQLDMRNILDVLKK